MNRQRPRHPASARAAREKSAPDPAKNRTRKRASAKLPGQEAKASRVTARRETILAAALDEFSVGGFAATRLDDVAKRAGVAKGTIYLYFRDKETLFQELVRSMLSPVVGAAESMPKSDLPIRDVAERLITHFVRDIFNTRRKDVIRLVIAEGPRFPKLAEFYYREVLSRVMAVMRGLIEQGIARGEIKNRSLAKFPQLLVAPGLVSIVWSGLFDRFAPIDIEAMMRTHLDLLFGERKVS